MSSDLNPYAAPKFPGNPDFKTKVEPDPKRFKRRHLATLWQRFAGSVIDSIFLILVFLPLCAAIGIVVGIFFPAYLEMEDTPLSLFVESVVIMLLFSAVFLALNAILLSRHGQTIGKYFMNTQIVSDNDELVPLKSLFFKRYLILWIVNAIPQIGNPLTLVDSCLLYTSPSPRD